MRLWFSVVAGVLRAAAFPTGVDNCFGKMADGISASSHSLGMGGALLASDIKLDGQNYREWSSSVRMLLRSIGLLSYITADPPSEKTDVKEAIA